VRTHPFNGTQGLRRLLQAHQVLGKHDDLMVKAADAGTAAIVFEERMLGADLLIVETPLAHARRHQ